MNRYDMQQSQYPPNRGYPRPQGGNLPRQHAPQQHHMGQQQPQHQGQPQANQQQQARPVLPQMAQQFHYGHPQQQVYVANYAPQIAAQNMSATGQSVTYPRVYYPYPAQQFQPIPAAWNQMTLSQAQQPGLPQAYYQTSIPTQVATAQQMQAAQHQFYAQQAGAAFVRGVGITTAPPQPMQIQHQPNHPGHHAHPPQHVQPTPGVQVQGPQPPPPQAPDPRETVAPVVPRERKVLKIINPDTGESVIDSPPVPPTPPVEEPAAQTVAATTTTDEVSPTPQHVVPAVVQVNNQPGEDIVVKPAETEEPAHPKSNARAEFFQKISQSAEEDRPMSGATSPSPNSTTPMPTTSTPAGAAVEPEVSSTATPTQTPEVVSIDNEVKEEEQPQREVCVEEEENLDTTLDTTPNNFDEPSLVDISSVSIDNYIDDTPEKPVASVEPAQPSAAIITNESESRTPESLVKEDVPAPTTPVVTPPQEIPVAPTSTPRAPTPETETQAPVNHVEKLEETTDLTDLTMQNKKLDEEILQNGDQVTEGEDEEVDDDEAPESVEEGEIVDGSGEEPEEQGKKKRIRYDRDTLLGFKAIASKDALPGMNSIPPEVIKDANARSGSNQVRGSPSLNNFPPRMGPHGGGNRRMGGPPGMQYMGRPGTFTPFAIPPPPPSNRPPPRVIELSREEVKLHKAEHAWKPTPVQKRTRGGVKTEDKDEDELVKDDIVKKTRGILNKLTPENFDKLVLAFLGLNLEDKDDRIAAVIYVVFEKAIDEPSFSTAYANMVKTVCDKSQLTAKKFRKNILDQCQKEFQKGSTAEEEIKALEEQLATAEEEKKEELKLELADKKYASRRRSLGNVRFIGELYKLQMLTPKIMIDCVNILLNNHDEESFESLCKLLTTIGQRLDNQLKELEMKAALALRSNPPTPVKFSPPEKYMDKTFENLRVLSQDLKLSSRIRFALLDVIELRECNWKPRRDADGPKKIGEVHRDAIRQQQEEKIQLQNLPPQGPPMRPGSMPQKKMNDWSTVPSNKSSRFQVKKPTGASSGQESSPMLAPNRGGSWNSPGGGGQLPPRSNQFIPPRLQTQQSQGRFGVLSQEDRAPPPTPLRENIVQAPPPPLRTQGSRESSRPQTPTRDQAPPMRPEPIKAPTPPPPKDVAPIDIGESVKNIFQEFMSTSNLEDVAYYIKQSFPGDKVFDFVDQLSKQVCDMSKETQEKGAGALVKGLIKRNLITQAQVIKVFTEGLMIDLPDIEVDVPKVTSYLGVFLVELFLDEPDLSWLLPLGESIEEQEPTVWANLVTNTLNFLKLRLSEEAVQVLYKKTENANRLPVDDLPWIAGESVETLSKKMLLVLEKEKDSANISDSFKENSWDLREELTSKSLTEAICQFSWKAAGGWDVPVLQKLLPQLMTAHPRLHPQLWNQAKEFIKRNSIRTEEEEELWEEMHKLKLTSRESIGNPVY